MHRRPPCRRFIEAWPLEPYHVANLSLASANEVAFDCQDTLPNVRRYVHHRTGCFTCSTSDLLIGAEYNRPTAFTERPLLAGNDQPHYSWCLDNVSCDPFILMPAHGHSISLSHTHALLLPSLLHLLASWCREAISDFTYPPFLHLVSTHRSLGSHQRCFLGRGMLLPLPGF